MQVAPTRSKTGRTADAIVAAAVAVVLAGGAGAFAAVQLTSPPDEGSNASGPTPILVVRSTPMGAPTDTPTPTPTPMATAPSGDSVSGDGGSSGGTDGGSSSGSSGSSGGSGGGESPPPPPPPAEPPYTDADAQAAVVNRWGAVPIFGQCFAANYGSWGRHSTPPAPVYVGTLAYEAGALPDADGGWVQYYDCE